MLDNRSKSIIENQMLNRKIVYAINKAITDDIPQARRENHLETNNRHIFASGDYINDNLRKYVVKDEVDLIPFKRYAWEGRILVDKANKITYTISTHQTLKNVIRKNRSKPHYLMSILYAENGDCQGKLKQMTLSDICPELKSTFDSEELEEDYDKIMQGSVSRTDGYKHYIVVYTANHNEITGIEMLLLDKDFAEVEKISLMEYVNPDFATLTASQYNGAEAEVAEEEPATKPVLLKLKPGVKPALRAMEEEA